VSDPTPLSDPYFAHWAAFYDGEYPDGENLRKVAADALRSQADIMEGDYITTGSIGPLMDVGYATACKTWAKALRAEADRVERK